MSEHRTTESDLYVRAVELTCSSDELRREMLWLRAMEKRDEEAAKKMESIDPELRGRVADVIASVDGLDSGAAGEVYGRARDERMETALAIVRRQAAQQESAS